MTNILDHKSGKWEEDENFPVASFLISSHHRSVMKAFYRFARSADDAADNSTMTPSEKFKILENLEGTLLGSSDAARDAIPLRELSKKRGLSTRHAQDLLVAFRQDVTKSRYQSWEELLQYCSFSANPVGRFILDVHGEDPSTYAYSDTLCTTLQIINHLQDCKKDFLELNRVYIPLSEFNCEGIDLNELSKNKASIPLSRIFRKIINETRNLKPKFENFSISVKDHRLSLEISVISGIANKLLLLLKKKDLLQDRVHLNYLESISVAAYEVFRHCARRYL